MTSADDFAGADGSVLGDDAQLRSPDTLLRTARTAQLRTGRWVVAPMMFVNLPVADVSRSREFFGRLGFVFDEMFCDRSTLCMSVNQQTMVIMHRRNRFCGYASSPVADLRAGREAVLALSASSRTEVDRCADAAFDAGATPLRAADDLGFMYARSFCDPDGHAWEFVWMDGAQIAGGPGWRSE